MIDFITESYGKEITIIYGEAGAGKTTLVKLAALAVAKEGNKVLFIDTEHGFHFERFQQLAGKDAEIALKNIFIIKPETFDYQTKKISELIAIAKSFSLIIIDTIGLLYRKDYPEDRKKANATLEKQMRILTEISRNVPVILTNQVYADIDANALAMVGGDYIKQWCKKIIFLQKQPRALIQQKPIKQKVPFTITSSGFSFP